MLDNCRISVARVAEIMDSWIRHLHYMQLQQRTSNEIAEKISNRHRVFPAKGQS